MKRNKNFKSDLLDRLADHEYAKKYLNAVLERGNTAALAMAIRNVAEAHDLGISALTKKAKIGRTSFYKSFSKKGNPELETIQKVMRALGFRLSVET